MEAQRRHTEHSAPIDRSAVDRSATAELVQAHQLESDALQYIARQQSRIESATDTGARTVECDYRLADDRETVFRVYFHAAGAADVMVVELIEVDSRPAAPRERMDLERDFREQLASGGEVWLRFLSQL